MRPTPDHKKKAAADESAFECSTASASSDARRSRRQASAEHARLVDITVTAKCTRLAPGFGAVRSSRVISTASPGALEHEHRFDGRKLADADCAHQSFVAPPAAEAPSRAPTRLTLKHRCALLSETSRDKPHVPTHEVLRYRRWIDRAGERDDFEEEAVFVPHSQLDTVAIIRLAAAARRAESGAPRQAVRLSTRGTQQPPRR